MKGLINLGNTCCINVVIQCIINTTLFAKFSQIYKIKYITTTTMNYIKINYEYDNTLTKDMLIYKFLKIIKKNDDPCNPKKIVNILGKKIDIGIQQDSQEILNCIFDVLHNETKINKNNIEFSIIIKNISKNETIKKSIDYWKNNIYSDYSIITHLFGCVINNNFSCVKCHKNTCNFEYLNMISLDITDKSPDSIYDLLDNFTTEEIMDENNKLYCETCKENNKVIKKINFWDTSNILIFYVKQYKFTNNTAKKINYNMNYVQTLELNKYTSNPLNNKHFYSLNGIIEQMGTINKGHYINYLYNNNKWYMCNDSNVVECSPQINGNGCIFIYKKI